MSFTSSKSWNTCEGTWLLIDLIRRIPEKCPVENLGPSNWKCWSATRPSLVVTICHHDLSSFNCPQVGRPEAESPMRYHMVVTPFSGLPVCSDFIRKAILAHYHNVRKNDIIWRRLNVATMTFAGLPCQTLADVQDLWCLWLSVDQVTSAGSQIVKQSPSEDRNYKMNLEFTSLAIITSVSFISWMKVLKQKS